MKTTATKPALILSRCNSFGLLLGQRLHQLPRGPTPVRIVDIGDELFGYLVDDLQRPPQQFSFVTAETIENQESGETIGYRVLLFLVDSDLDHRPEIAGHIRRFTSSDELGQRGQVRLLPRAVRNHATTMEAAPTEELEDASGAKPDSESVRRQFPNTYQLLPEHAFDQLGQVCASLFGEPLPSLTSDVGESQLSALLFAGSLLGHKETREHIHRGITRVKSGSSQQKAFYPGIILARPGCCPLYLGTDMPAPSTNQGNGQQPKTPRKPQHGTELTINPELAALGKEHFETTRYKSLTGFVNKALLREMRKQASAMRAKGMKVPEWLFLK